MKKLLIILFAIIPIYAANCETDIHVTDASEISDSDIIPAEQLLTRTADATECATQAFADALAKRIADVPEDTPESDIETLIQAVFTHGDTLKTVIECPEIANADEMDDIKFLPIKYTFPGGREIVINYETQPKILKQRLQMANKASLPGGEASPRLGDLNDPTIWTNTDPAWYGIIVTQAGTLRNFVGDGNNNTISLRYIEDNIDTLMPQSKQCTSGSALADDNENINLALVRTTQDKSQDYYVSGDVNLQWISYMEIGLDVVITVVTFGGGAVVSGVTKAARAARVMHNLATGMRALAKTKSVANYIKMSNRYAKLVAKTKNLKRTRITALDKDLERATKQLAKMKPGSKNHVAQKARVDELTQRVKALDDLALDPNNATARELLENSSKTARQSMNQVLEDGVLKADPNDAKEMEKLAKDMKNLEKTDKNVKQYQEAANAFADLQKYRHALRLKKLPAQRGNVIARTLKSFKAANTGGAKISKANKVAQKTIKVANQTMKAEAKQAAEIARLKSALNTDLAHATEQLKKMTPGSAEHIAQQTKIADMTKQAHTLDNIGKAETSAEEVTKTLETLSKTYKVGTITKAINGLKTIFGGGQKLEYARVSLKGGRLRDWLFQSSMKNVGKLARLEEKGGLLYGTLKFAGDMYDWSETSTGDYTSGIEFKPLLLLSADDIDGQDNVVNHGMWLLWQGDTYSASDDDAAYLQAMDFAEKFYRDLLDVQSETNDNSCDVDIYVVRPIIRNPGSDDAELYYLIMNDVPWTTNE
ncbi:MAG: hypothetical protein K2M34_01625 [Alphaproteobacteria bacterium]|nr:hypothetical protein [Alphaproteobacteria bacterium]